MQRFTEKSFDLPLQVVGADSTMRINLYPSHVKLVAWVPVNEFENYRPRDFHATVHYDATVSSNDMEVRIEQYPGTVRVKSIEPKNVKYVIIK